MLIDGFEYSTSCPTVRYGVVWCGVVRCGAVRCDAVRCGVVRLSFHLLFRMVRLTVHRTKPRDISRFTIGLNRTRAVIEITALGTLAFTSTWNVERTTHYFISGHAYEVCVRLASGFKCSGTFQASAVDWA